MEVSEEVSNQVTHDMCVSVVMLAYKHEDYIAQAIESVLMQETDFAFELCIGEDESPDRTREICLQYAEKYPDKIRLFLRSRKDVQFINGRATGRRNNRKTRQATRGRYITFLEGDDFWIDPNKLQKQVEFFKANPQCSIHASRALTWFQDVPERTYIRPCPVWYGEFKHEDFLCRTMPVNTCTLMFRKEVLPSKDPEWMDSVIAGDHAFLLELTRHGRTCVIVPDVSAVYRKHAGGIWSGTTALQQVDENLRFWSAYQTTVKDNEPRMHLAQKNVQILELHRNDILFRRKERSLSQYIKGLSCHGLMPAVQFLCEKFRLLGLLRRGIVRLMGGPVR